MKLYELPRGTWFRLVKGTIVPPSAPEVHTGHTYLLHNIDGMYSLCQDTDGNTVHVAVFAEVEQIEPPHTQKD